LSGHVEEIRREAILLDIQENFSHKNCFFSDRVKYNIFYVLLQGAAEKPDDILVKIK